MPSSYSITPSADGKYILLKVVGDTNRQALLGYNLEAHTLGRELNIDCFLLDFTESHNTDTVLRNYVFVNSDMKDAGINWAAKIAMLAAPYDHSFDFIEALFRAAGADVTLFHDRELAIWRLTQPAE